MTAYLSRTMVPYPSAPSSLAQVHLNGHFSANDSCGTDHPLRSSSGKLFSYKSRPCRQVGVSCPSISATDFCVSERAESEWLASSAQNCYSTSSMETTWPPMLAFQPAFIPSPESVNQSRRMRGIPSYSKPTLPPLSRAIARPTMGSLTLPAQPVEILSPKPYKCYQKASFLSEKNYGCMSYQSSCVDSEDIVGYSEERERELLSASLLFSMNESRTEDPLRPSLCKPLPVRPLWPSVTPSTLETAAEDYSSSTSAYHTFLSPLEPRPRTTEEVDSITARLELLDRLASECTPSTPSSMPALESPAGSDSELSGSGSGSPASSESSPSSFNTSLASLDDVTSVKEDLQGYTERMVAQIFGVCKLEEIVASTWFLAMQAKFLACQDHLASGDRATG